MYNMYQSCYDHFRRKQILSLKVKIKILSRCVVLCRLFKIFEFLEKIYRLLKSFIFNQFDVALFKEIRCPSLLDPINGAVNISGTLIDGVATFSCNPGFTLTDGSLTRTCAPNGSWTGTSAECSGM